MKKKVKKSQGKRTRGATKRPQIPTQEPSPAPPWRRPWILTSTDEYDERTVSAEMYAVYEARGNWHRITQRTEEEEQHYQMLLQQEYHELGARDRERAAAYAEAERHQQFKAQEEADRRALIAAKAAKKKAKGAAKAAADAAAKSAATAAAKAAAAEREAAKAAEAERSERNRVAATAAAAGAQRQRQRAQHGRAAHAAADAARHRAGRREQHNIASRAAAETARERAVLNESIEEMVGRIEREMEEEFETLFPSAAAAAAAITKTAAAMAAGTRVPEAKELEDMEKQNKIFNSSFIPSAPTMAAATVAPPDTTTAAATAAPVATAEPSGMGNNNTIPTDIPTLPQGIKTQTPPNIEPTKKPPPDIDKRKEAPRHQGCRQHRTVSRKGVLDIIYLASGRGPECRSRYRFGAEARVREVYPRLARQ
jgi:hypothetical protein